MGRGQRTSPDQPRGPIPTLRVKMLRHHHRSAANTTLLFFFVVPSPLFIIVVIICGEGDWLLADENLENGNLTMMTLESEEMKRWQESASAARAAAFVPQQHHQPPKLTSHAIQRLHIKASFVCLTQKKPPKHQHQ